MHTMIFLLSLSAYICTSIFTLNLYEALLFEPFETLELMEPSRAVLYAILSFLVGRQLGVWLKTLSDDLDQEECAASPSPPPPPQESEDKRSGLFLSLTAGVLLIVGPLGLSWYHFECYEPIVVVEPLLPLIGAVVLGVLLNPFEGRPLGVDSLVFTLFVIAFPLAALITSAFEYHVRTHGTTVARLSEHGGLYGYQTPLLPEPPSSPPQESDLKELIAQVSVLAHADRAASSSLDTWIPSLDEEGHSATDEEVSDQQKRDERVRAQERYQRELAAWRAEVRRLKLSGRLLNLR